MRRPGSERLKPGGALVDFSIRNLLNHRGSRWFQHKWGLIMQLPMFGKCRRDLMRRWEFFGEEVLGPRIFYRRRRPGSRSTTSLGLRAMLVKAQSSVNDTFGLFDRRPLQMQLVMLLKLGPSTIARNTALARQRRAKQPEVGTDLPWRLVAHCWLHCIFGHSQHF